MRIGTKEFLLVISRIDLARNNIKLYIAIYCISLASYVGLYYTVDKYKYACVSLLDQITLLAASIIRLRLQPAEARLCKLGRRATGRQTGRHSLRIRFTA